MTAPLLGAIGIMPIATAGVFILAFVGSRFMGFCVDNDQEWWGGFPLWMAGAIGFLLPMALGLAVLCIYIGKEIAQYV